MLLRRVGVFMAIILGLSVPAGPAPAQASTQADVLRAVTSSQGTSDIHAPDGGAKVVVFGDSHASGTNAPFRADERGCLKGTGSWPAQLQANLGLARGELIDVSCNGASINSGGLHFSDEVREAEARGAIGARTEQIIIQFGKNDHWGQSSVSLRNSVINCLTDLANGCGDRAIAAGTMQDPGAVTAEHYAQRMEPVIDYLRYFAPNADITLLGYQEFLPRSGSEVCVRLGGLDIRKPDASALVSYMDRLENAIAGASEILEVHHVDLRAATTGRSSCSGDPLANGVLDLRANLIGMPWHPSVRGDAVTAGLLTNQVRGSFDTP